MLLHKYFINLSVFQMHVIISVWSKIKKVFTNLGRDIPNMNQSKSCAFLSLLFSGGQIHMDQLTCHEWVDGMFFGAFGGVMH